MSRKIGSSAWSSFLGKALPVSLVGAHLTAAALGLYTSAPDVTFVQPARDASRSDADASGSDARVIEVRADDGPKGSGVRSVEYQLDSTLGTWRPLSLDSHSMTYKAMWAPVGVAEGRHELYVRATDNTGNSRKAHVTVKVTH